MTSEDRLVIYRDTETPNAVREVVARTKQYAGRPQLLVFSRGMAAALAWQFPWTLQQTAKNLKVIAAKTYDERKALSRMVVLIGGLLALVPQPSVECCTATVGQTRYACRLR